MYEAKPFSDEHGTVRRDNYKLNKEKSDYLKTLGMDRDTVRERTGVGMGGGEDSMHPGRERPPPREMYRTRTGEMEYITPTP